MIFFLASPVLAGGPKYSYKEPLLNDEMTSIYKAIDDVLKGDVRISSVIITTATIAGVSVPGIFQIQQGLITASTSTTVTGSFIRTGLSVTITPSRTTHRIFVIANLGRLATTTASIVYATLERNGSNLAAGANGFQVWDNNAAGGAPATISYLDSPASTSALTYEVYMKGTAGTTSVNDTDGTASIIAVETF